LAQSTLGLTVAYLSGMSGPVLLTCESWGVEGIEWKVRLDFRVDLFDWRTIAKNPGA
jgi:hypothetical protein